MKVLITGGCGFIGTNAALGFLRSGDQPICMDNLQRVGVEENMALLSKAGAEIIRGDVRNADDFDRIPEVDAVIHLAANPAIPLSFRYPVYDFKINAYGSINVLEFARRRGGLPCILISTNKVYTDELNKLPMIEEPTRYRWKEIEALDEHCPVDGLGLYPKSPYGVSKTAADLYFQEYGHHFGVPTAVFRLSCCYGLYQKGVQDQGWIDWFCRAKKFGYPLTIFGNGKQVRDALWGGDLAELFVLSIHNFDKVNRRVFNVGGGPENTLSLLELIQFLESMDGEPMQVRYAPWRKADQIIYVSNIEAIRKATGWKPKMGVWQGVQELYNSL
jgi:CDP-paratose 2-epimerase